MLGPSHCAGTFTGRVRTRQYGTCSWTPEGRREDSSLLVNLLPGHKPLLGRIQLSVTRTLHYNLGKFFQEKSYTIINIKLGTKVNISLKREIITIAYFLKSWQVSQISQNPRLPRDRAPWSPVWVSPGDGNCDFYPVFSCFLPTLFERSSVFPPPFPPHWVAS